VLYAIAVAAILAWVALYAYWTAQRLDRLHARVDAAATALKSQLLRRSATATELSALPALPRALSGGLLAAAREAANVPGLGHDREVAETAVSRALFGIVSGAPETFSAPTPVAAEMHDEALRASFARRFYNDTVRDALVIRDRRIVRWLRLAGHAPHPAYFEMDDAELPPARISVASGPTIEP
jgi:hypothetical protein